MLEDRPVLKEGLCATATFGGIALATALALDFIITGGFDFGARRSSSSYVDLFAAVSDANAAPPQTSATAVTLSEPLLIEETPQDESLAGDDSVADSGDAFPTPSEDELYRQIAALYAEQDARAEAAEAAHVEEPAYADAPLVLNAPADKPAASASETESPW